MTEVEFPGDTSRTCIICPICRFNLVDKCIECQKEEKGKEKKYCSIVWTICAHAYHRHCGERWIKTRSVCPLDNNDWKEYCPMKYKRIKQMNDMEESLALLHEKIDCLPETGTKFLDAYKRFTDPKEEKD